MANVSSSNSQKALVPKLRFPGFEGEWTARKIIDFASCYAGATPSTKEPKYWENGTIPWLSSGEVNKKYIKGTDSFITECGFNSCSTKMVPADTVVMALAGQGKTRGNVAIAEIPLCTNQSLAAIVTDNSVNNYCLLYFFETQYENLRLISSGDGTRGGLNLSLINNYTVTLPAVDEQNKLASFIYKLDQRIDSQRKLIEILKSYNRGVTKAIFNPDSAYQNCAESWRLRKVSELLSYEQPQKYIVQTEHYSSDYATPVLTANKGFILGYTNESTGVYDKGDVVIYDDFTMDMKYVNFPFKVKSSTIKFLTAKPGNNLYFLFCLLQSLSLTPEGHQRSYISKVEKMNVFVPSVGEQSRIAEILKKVTAILERHELALHKLETLKAGLLNQLFI